MTTDPDSPVRVRVVLAERRGSRALVRTAAEVQEQTEVGEVLLHGLLRAQLRLSLRMAALVAVPLLAMPLLFALLPRSGDVSVFGLRLSWLALGLLVYPFLLLIGWRYVRLADHTEQDFADIIDD